MSSRAGRGLQAIAAGEAAAAVAGIAVASSKLRLFVFAAALAGLAGGLFTFYAQFVGPEDFAIVLSLQFVVMVAVGGLGNVYGAAVGTVSILYLEHKLRELGTHERLLGWTLPPQAPSILSLGVFGSILIAVMLFFPHGCCRRCSTPRAGRAAASAGSVPAQPVQLRQVVGSRR